MFMFGLKCFDDHARGDAQAITTYEDAMAYIEQQKSGMPQEEQQAFDRTIMDVILALNARDDAVRSGPRAGPAGRCFAASLRWKTDRELQVLAGVVEERSPGAVRARPEVQPLASAPARAPPPAATRQRRLGGTLGALNSRGVGCTQYFTAKCVIKPCPARAAATARAPARAAGPVNSEL